MILYHGTNIDFKAIELSICVPYKDFRKGFYLTDIRNQAEALAQMKSILFGGSPIVREYVFIPEDAEKGGLKMRFIKFIAPGYMRLFLGRTRICCPKAHRIYII